MRKFLLLGILAFFAVSCSDKGSKELDRDFGKGHNGILWGEGKEEAGSWLQGTLGAPVKVIRQNNPEALQKNREFRKRYIKRLKLRTVPAIDDQEVLSYVHMGLQYVMSFDKNDRFAAVTFGAAAPLAPLTKDQKPKETQKRFEYKVLNPLIAKYGKPRTARLDSRESVRRYWIWQGKQESYVLEFIFVKPGKQDPAYWQYSESIFLSHPKYYHQPR